MVRLGADLLHREGFRPDEPDETHRFMKAAQPDQQMFPLDQGMSCHGRFRGGDLPGKACGCRKFHDLLLTRACTLSVRGDE
jgi:hypothetical protein